MVWLDAHASDAYFGMSSFNLNRCKFGGYLGLLNVIGFVDQGEF